MIRVAPIQYAGKVGKIAEDARRNNRFIDAGDLLALPESLSGAYHDARLLAEALRRVLTVEELARLCYEVEDGLEKSLYSTAAELKLAIARATESLKPERKDNARIADLPLGKSNPYGSGTIALAVILQALEWAIEPPEPPMP